MDPEPSASETCVPRPAKNRLFLQRSSRQSAVKRSPYAGLRGFEIRAEGFTMNEILLVAKRTRTAQPSLHRRPSPQEEQAQPERSSFNPRASSLLSSRESTAKGTLSAFFCDHTNHCSSVLTSSTESHHGYLSWLQTSTSRDRSSNRIVLNTSIKPYP